MTTSFKKVDQILLTNDPADQTTYLYSPTATLRQFTVAGKADGDTIAIDALMSDFKVKIKNNELTLIGIKNSPSANGVVIKLSFDNSDGATNTLAFADGAVDVVFTPKAANAVKGSWTFGGKKIGGSLDIAKAVGKGQITIDGADTYKSLEDAFKAEKYTLTSDVDIASAKVFNSQPAYTPGGNDFVNSLQDEDQLTGVGPNAVLNVTLGSVNDAAEEIITPKLTNIPTVNVDVVGQANGINFQNAAGVTTLNLNRLTAENGVAEFQDLDKTTTNLSVNSVTRGGEINFQYREEVLTATNDAVNLGINSVRVHDLNLFSLEDGGADTGYFFEAVNVTTTGNNDIDEFYIEANGLEDELNDLAPGTTRQALNITANGGVGASVEINSLNAPGVEDMTIQANARVDIADDKREPLSRENDGISTPDLENLTIRGGSNVMIDGLDTEKQDTEGGEKTLTVNASTMTGNLKLGVASSADGDVSTVYDHRADKDLVVTSGSGNDEIRTYGNLAGDITTNNGNDIVEIESATSSDMHGDVEGVSTIDTGAGNDTVHAGVLMATATDYNEEDNGGFDDVTAARIITGAGDDEVRASQLLSELDWDNKATDDANADDLNFVKGASIDTGDGNDVVILESDAQPDGPMPEEVIECASSTIEEGASVNTGAGNDALHVTFDQHTTILAGDTDADSEVVIIPVQGGDTREVTAAGDAADRFGARVNLGAGADTATFTIVDSDGNARGNNDYTIVGRDAELDGGDGNDVMNVVALDKVTVAARTGGESDANVTIKGIDTANFTVENQVTEDQAEDAATSQRANWIDITETTTHEAGNDESHCGGLEDGEVSADIARFDTALKTINLVSRERVLLNKATAEGYDAGTITNFSLSNLRSDIALSLVAVDATGVDGDGVRKDDTQLSIDANNGEVTTNCEAADVRLNIDMVAPNANDVFTLNVNAGSDFADKSLDSYDLSLNFYANNTADGARNSTGEHESLIEKVVINLVDNNSHSLDLNHFGDYQFVGEDEQPELPGDVSRTVSTSLTVNSAAGTDKKLSIDAVNADVIKVQNAAGTGVTAADVTLRVDRSNNYTITTGTGDDILDMRADVVRSDDVESLVDRADHINAGRGRDTLIVSGDNSLSNNNLDLGATGYPGTGSIINDDVFETMEGVETILVDTNVEMMSVVLEHHQHITLNEAAKETGIDTVKFVGEDSHSVAVVIGNDFGVSTQYNPETGANGNQFGVDDALVIDADLQTGNLLLDIDNRDDDTELDRIALDMRVNAANGVAVNFLDAGADSEMVQIQIRAAENVHNRVDATNGGGFDGLTQITVNGVEATRGSIDRIVMINAEDGSSEYLSVNISDQWTQNDGMFEFDASQLTLTGEDMDLVGLEAPDYSDNNNDSPAPVADVRSFIKVDDGNVGEVLIKATAHDDFVVGGLISSTEIHGNGGWDILVGGRVEDTIMGGDGDDVIQGDRIEGGAQGDIKTLTFDPTYASGQTVSIVFNSETYTHILSSTGPYAFDVNDFTGLSTALADANVTVDVDGEDVTFTDGDEGTQDGEFQVSAFVGSGTAIPAFETFAPSAAGTSSATTWDIVVNGGEAVFHVVQGAGGFDSAMAALVTQINDSSYDVTASYNSSTDELTITGVIGEDLPTFVMWEDATLIVGSAEQQTITADVTGVTTNGPTKSTSDGSFDLNAGGLDPLSVTYSTVVNGNGKDADPTHDNAVATAIANAINGDVSWSAVMSASVVNNVVTINWVNDGDQTPITITNKLVTAGSGSLVVVEVNDGELSQLITTGADEVVGDVTEEYTPTGSTVGLTVVQNASDGDVVLAQDVLSGGDGQDTFVILNGVDETGSVTRLIYDADNGPAVTEVRLFDTINDLNLGDNGFDAIDKIGLNFQIDTILNGNVPDAMTGATLVQAVNSLFQNGGDFDYDDSNPESENAAGLFTWGGHTYLIAAGESSNAAGFGADDVIVDVTGFTGTISTDDFVLNYIDANFDTEPVTNVGVAIVNVNDPLPVII